MCVCKCVRRPGAPGVNWGKENSKKSFFSLHFLTRARGICRRIVLLFPPLLLLYRSREDRDEKEERESAKGGQREDDRGE